MAVVARAGVPFDLKSTALSGLALVLRTADLASLAVAMAERFGHTPGVFSHEPVVIDLSALAEESQAPLDFVSLVGLLESHHLLPAGVRGGTHEWRQAALEVGLGDVSDDPTSPFPLADRSQLTVSKPPPSPAPDPTAAPGPAPLAAAPGPATQPATAVAPMTPPSVNSAPTSIAPTLIVDKPLRSGQQVYAKGGDLVVLATVNVGAEVIADGSIHVYGPLRGKAVAGAKGNVDARIFSTCMEPQLLAIAGTYRTTENPLPADVVGRPAQIRLEGERLVFEPLA